VVKWVKKGLIFKPTGLFPWMNSHAQVPYTLELDKVLRVYFSTRNKIDRKKMFKSLSGYVDLDKNNLSKIISISKKPILRLGGKGEFDEFGSMAGSVIYHNKKYFLYYCGWTRCLSVPYNWSIGLAVSNDGSAFKRYGSGPLLGAVTNEPYLQACPIVYKISKNNWHMYYLSGIQWFNYKGKSESQYLLMHAHSCDGIKWSRTGKPIIAPIVAYECQTSASIFKKDDKYHMLFSYRHGVDFREKSEMGYRIGYASSNDLVKWKRDDLKVGLNTSDSGWDSKMIAYPHVFKLNGKFNLFCCGNNFGQDGFGWATLES